ncbi:MAG: DUF1549 domain-containing protein [Pirellulaceae bacterium]|nr:DUF1549 domain-containing protein [Pirellulaceae bacterium]
MGHHIKTRVAGKLWAPANLPAYRETAMKIAHPNVSRGCAFRICRGFVTVLITFVHFLSLTAAGQGEVNTESAAVVSPPGTETAQPSLPDAGQVQSESLPLWARIDAIIPKLIEPLTAPVASDGELLRRLSLDLRGVTPTREELDAFVEDKSPERWQKYVSRFLNDPMCDEHLVAFLDRTLMLRRPHAQVDRASWLNYLREQVASNLPIDQLSKQLLYSPWWNRDQRSSQRFYLDRAGDPNLIARDLSRVFLGRDIQCAQCHDHPLVADYTQIDYHGLLAFVSPSNLAESVFKDAEGKDQKTQQYIERAANDAPFESVFEKGVRFRSGPRLPSQPEQFEEYLPNADRYVAAAPPNAIAGVPLPPKQSRREQLADQLTARSNPSFVANWSNRFWAMVFGQGLVQPLDMEHPDNPPMQPELFALITSGLIEVDMQPRRFVEQLVLTQTYQRGGFTALQVATASSTPSTLTEEQCQAIRSATSAPADELITNKASMVAAEVAALAEYESAREAWRSVQAERATIRAELDAAEAAMLAAQKKSTEAAAALTNAQKSQTDTQSRIALLDESATKLQQAVDLAGGEDAELKQAIAVAKQRAEVARGQIPTIDKAVADASALVDATKTPLQESTANVQAIIVKLQPVHMRLLASDNTMLTARVKWSTAHSALIVTERGVQRYAHTLAWLAGVELLKRSIDEVNQSAQVVANVDAEIATANSQVAIAQTQIVVAEQAQQTSATELAIAKETMERHSNELAQLRMALDGLAVATKLVNAPGQLAAAQQSLQAELNLRSPNAGQLQAAVDTAGLALATAMTLVAQRKQELTSQQSALELIHQRLATARESLMAKQAESAATKEASFQQWGTVYDDCSQQLSVAALQALTPEQLCWSTLRVTGRLDASIQTELLELDKLSPLAANADEPTVAARRRQAVRQAYDKLRGNADVFVSLFASGADKTQDDFFASADQALFTANAGSIFAWAGPENNNVTQQAIELTDSTQIAQLIYWTLLCRQPTVEEKKLIVEQLAAEGDKRNSLIQEIVWGLLASAEFRFCR